MYHWGISAFAGIVILDSDAYIMFLCCSSSMSISNFSLVMKFNYVLKCRSSFHCFVRLLGIELLTGSKCYNWCLSATKFVRGHFFLIKFCFYLSYISFISWCTKGKYFLLFLFLLIVYSNFYFNYLTPENLRVIQAVEDVLTCYACVLYAAK